MYQQFISFFQDKNLYDKEMFDYFYKNSSLFDYRIEEYRDFAGCFYVINKDILNKIKLVVPYIEDDKTILVNIHEYIHAILCYQRLGKKFKLGLDREALPLLYEKIYILERNTPELIDYRDYLNSFITDNCGREYQFGLSIQDELLRFYFQGESIYQLDKRAKKLAKRYKC